MNKPKPLPVKHKPRKPKPKYHVDYALEAPRLKTKPISLISSDPLYRDWAKKEARKLRMKKRGKGAKKIFKEYRR